MEFGGGRVSRAAPFLAADAGAARDLGIGNDDEGRSVTAKPEVRWPSLKLHCSVRAIDRLTS